MPMDVVDYEIRGAEMQFVEVELDPGEAAVGEAGSMMFMDAGIGMDTVFGDGSSSSGGLFGKLLGAGKRLVTGESLFTTVYTNQGAGKLRVAFAAPYPGKIILARHEQMADRLGRSGMTGARLADVAVDRFGYPFAPREIVKIGLRIMLGRVAFKLPKSLGPRDAFICSEYVGKCLETLNIEIPWDGKGFIAPVDFARCPEVHALAQFKTR